MKSRTHLRRCGKRIVKERQKFNTIHPVHTIHELPETAKSKNRLGDFEGDTVCSSKGCLVTFVDRKSKLLTAALSYGRDKSSVRAAISKAFSLLEYEIPIESILLDNGSEFADFLNIEKDLDTTIYFANPHSLWQRRLIENTNDIIRFFFPKGTDFSKVSEAEVQKVVHLINSRPRKCLDYLSPIEFLSKSVALDLTFCRDRRRQRLSSE